MNKKEAAAFLGVTTRSLERYVSQNKLKVKYVKGKTRPVAVFDAVELEKLKQEMASLPLSQRPSLLIEFNGENNTVNGNGSKTEVATRATTQLKRAKTETLTKSRQGILNPDDAASPMLKKLLASLMANNKIILTLAEAAALTNISQQELRKAIGTGALSAAMKGRGWKIRRKDLESYVEKLW